MRKSGVAVFPHASRKEKVMNSMKKMSLDSSDVENGAMDSGCDVSLVIQKAANTAPKTSARDDAYDPKAEINYYGVGVAKMDA